MISLGGNNGNSGDAWLELAAVSPSLWRQLGDPSDNNSSSSSLLTVCLSMDGGSGNPNSLSSLVVQVVSTTDARTTEKEGPGTSAESVVMSLHPMLYCFLHQVAIISTDNDDDNTDIVPGCQKALIRPLPLMEFQAMIYSAVDNDDSTVPQEPRWTVTLLDRVVDWQGGENSIIHLSCVYVEKCHGPSSDMGDFSMNQLQAMTIALQGRILKQGCVILLDTHIYGYVIAKVLQITSSDHNNDAMQQAEAVVGYRIAGRGDYQLIVDPPPVLPSDMDMESDYHQPSMEGIPGYEDLQHEIVKIFQLDPTESKAAVSGVLVTGCSGVGKTRLAHSVAHMLRQQQHGPFKMYYLSVQDLIFQASFHQNLLQNVILPNLRDCTLWILDDLHLLETDEEEEEVGIRNVELLLVRNALIEAIDQSHAKSRILGIAQREEKLPHELTKIGRLEKCIQMLPPTQSQRTEIWNSVLQYESGSVSEETRREWSQTLTPLTPGCVARDLIRAYQDGRTHTMAERGKIHEKNDSSVAIIEWKHLKEAVRTLIPSQLAELDVIKPIAFDSKLSDKEIHAQAFQNFGGYSQLKKHLYRQVVSPWKLFLNAKDGNVEPTGLQSWLKPPPGVLFHGPSGTGKTEAAWCLAASLQLPVIQVRAADVLNKWLGGSESLLRSLFAKARSASPCILFLDEIDSLAGNREEEETNDYSSRILSTLLNEMDGVSTSIYTSQVLVLACTNRQGSLDAALLRPGRLQEHFHMQAPLVFDLEEMLRMQFDQIPMDSSVSLDIIAVDLFEMGATGADVKGICREVCMMAMRDCSGTDDNFVVGLTHFERTILDHFHADQV
jgi:SpoVK/Ycf46/Vps4 family AAA+-type ATPase